MVVADVDYSERIGSETNDVFIAETRSYSPEVMQDKAVLCDGTYIYAYNDSGTEYIIDTNGASTEWYNKLTGAFSFSSRISYKELPKTGLKAFAIADECKIIGKNDTVVANQKKTSHPSACQSLQAT